MLFNNSELNNCGKWDAASLEGNRVLTYSIVYFPAGRCADQTANDINYHQLPITVVTVGGGLNYGNIGYSNHAIKDYELMRCFPNMLIAAPGDPMEVRACIRYLVGTPQPSYLRPGKAGEQCFHSSVPLVAPGTWQTVLEADANDLGEKALLSTGVALGIAVGMREAAAYKGCAVHSLPLWGMRWKSAPTANVKALDEITTSEDHLSDGGFGSWITEAPADKTTATRVLARALSHEICDLVASQATLNELGGLTRTDPT